MSSRTISAIPKRLFGATLSSVFGLGLVVGTGLSAFSSEAINNRLVTYQDDGKTLFALSLLPTQDLAAKSSPRVVLIVDTSASQNGDFRTDSIEIAKSIAEALPSTAMVSLLACDVEPTLLSSASAPNAESIAAGFKKLEMRIPLGTTDLAAALRAAVKEFGKQQDGSIVYIGDGMHLCNLLNTREFESLINEMRETRTSVSSIAIGPKTDCELLSTICNHTGGKIFVRQGITDATCQQIGDALAKVALEPVFWPTKSSWPKGVASFLPTQLPPLRLDRDSIVVGSLKEDAVAGSLQLDGIVGGKSSSMRWELKSEPSNPDFAFLAQVVTKSTPNAGLMMPTAGSAALQELGAVLASSSDQLVKDARFALNSGDTAAAINIAKEAIKRSPNNLAAQTVLAAAEETKKPAKPVKTESASPKIVKFISFQVPEDPFADPPKGDASPAKEDDVPAPTASNPFSDDSVPATPVQPATGAGLDLPSVPSTFSQASDPFGELSAAKELLAEDEGMRRVIAQQLESQVKSELSQARNSKDPTSAKISLKGLQDQIRRSSELDAAGRARLEAQISSAIQAAARAEVNQRERIARTEAVQSSQSASKRLLAETERRNATVQQLVERYNSLMAQQMFTQANNEIAPQITAIDRDTVIDRVTNIESAMASNEKLIMDVVKRRSRAFVDSLYLNEQALVPFVDNPPIVYPPADVWQALSARRLERYGSIDLSGGKESERKIYRALNEKGDVSFNATPLSGVMKIFRDQYGIPIVIDDKALEAENITPEEPITLELPTVSFRSALKLILEPLQLTYVIEDEVMRITSKKTSANVVRVYPVGDLVVPVSSTGMMGGKGGMGGMGGLGGMGGGMGGMGGGMGGMGGGMGGMGGGGMGGMMNVDDQPSKDQLSKSIEKSATQLVEELVASEGGERLVAEAALKSWVVNKMVLAKRSSMANQDKEVRKHFQDVIDTIGDAMRKTLPAAWMYQALSTAMEGCEYPGSEIRRVLLSSIDFGADVDAAIKIGKYLSAQGMKKDALSVFHDAHRSNPMLKEPLELGLEISLDIQDQEGIRWASTGILSQAWTDDHVPMIQKALIAAEAAYTRLKNAKETAKMAAFEQELNQAQLRDLMVRVVWTGDADIDVSVEEPTGSVCDKSNPRTLGGGLHLMDGSSLDKPSKDGFSEMYVCASGYSGQYRILIRKVWGEVSGGKVTVNLATDFGTPDQKITQHVIALQQDAVLVTEVKNGHRKEPIVEAQLAQVQKRMSETGAVLAQMAPTSAGGSSSSYQNLLRSLYGGPNGIGNNGQGGVGPFIGRNVVGYRPILTFINQGTFMAPTAVISGDRRYVTVAPSPNFSDIIAVDTFNTFTGQTATGQGGGGAGGGGAQGGGGGGGFGGGGAQ